MGDCCLNCCIAQCTCANAYFFVTGLLCTKVCTLIYRTLSHNDSPSLILGKLINPFHGKHSNDKGMSQPFDFTLQTKSTKLKSPKPKPTAYTLRRQAEIK